MIITEGISLHAFGSVISLPIPAYLYWTAGAAVVILSFTIVNLFVRGRRIKSAYPTYDLTSRGWFRLLDNAVVIGAAKFTSAGIFILIILTGFLGSSEQSKNFAPVFVWIIWWVGAAYFHAFIGNFWSFLNPWKIIFGTIFVRIAGLPIRGLRPSWYPRPLGMWPAITLFLLFGWLELAYPEPAEPFTIALLATAYTITTFAGMAIFGMNTWLHNGEAFSVFFRFLSSFSITEVVVKNRSVCRACELACDPRLCINCLSCAQRAPRKQVSLRPFAIGVLNMRVDRFDAMAFVILMLSTVTFDGFSRTFVWYGLIGISPYSPDLLSLSIDKTFGLMGFFLAFIGIFAFTTDLVTFLSRSKESTSTVSQRFVVSLLPIAMVYQLAHYTTFILVNGQLIIRLISDPFGYGWNLFGTSEYPIIIPREWTLLWNYMVLLVVVGHVIAVYVAHLIALRLFPNYKFAVRSQYPMMVLMVAYTMVGLWLLSAPGV